MAEIYDHFYLYDLKCSVKNDRINRKKVIYFMHKEQKKKKIILTHKENNGRLFQPYGTEVWRAWDPVMTLSKTSECVTCSK